MERGRADGKRGARAALREFLMSRRARLSPRQAGLHVYGTNRRVSGLRREEVAMLAGISAEYYIRLERGYATGASPGVIEAVAQALQLDVIEREHLLHLIDAVNATIGSDKQTRSARSEPVDVVRPQVQVLVDGLTDLPAFVFNRRMDIVACNRLGRLLYAPIFEDPLGAGNTARFAFLNEPRAREFWPSWEQVVSHAVAVLRAEAGRHPHHPGLVELVGQLSTGSQEFRTRWAAHDVRDRGSGVKTMHHPVIGMVTMPYENLELGEDEDQYLMVYVPAAGTPAHDSLKLLASWGKTSDDDAVANRSSTADGGTDTSSH
jgi:transcriptional regulator with XRE-family HTH domain